MPDRSRRFLMLFSLVLGVSIHSASSACAHPVGPDVSYSVTAEDEWGNPLRDFHKSGDTFVLGSYGRRYNIRVRNQTGRRVEAVVTVDGRDVVSGRIGDFKNERGYLINPYSDVLIEGFRTSLHDVAAFRFASPAESYSSRMGTPQNVGVIGVAIFPERVVPPPPPRPRPLYHPRAPMDDLDSSYAPARKSESSGRGAGMGTLGADAPSASAAESSGSSYEPSAESRRSKGNLGTEYGEAHESHVQEVEFRRANATRPSQVIVLRYDDEEGLLARGFRLREPPAVSYAPRSPDPFPHSRFAPPPP